MNAQRVDIFYKADGYHIVFRVADYLKLKLLPAQNRLLNQNLTDDTRLKSSLADNLQLLRVIHKTAARAAHSVGGAQNYRITELVGYF